MTQETPNPELHLHFSRKYHVVSFLLVLALFVSMIYLAFAFQRQRHFGKVMQDLASDDPVVAREAEKELLDHPRSALPYLNTNFKYADYRILRVRSGELILRLLEEREARFRSLPENKRRSRVNSGIQLERVTAALLDEDPVVRELAGKIVAITGTQSGFQKQRIADRQTYETLLAQLRSETDPTRLPDIRDQFVVGGPAAVPFLSGTLYSDDRVFTRKAIAMLKDLLDDQLRGANLKRAVQVLGRRRTRLLVGQLDHPDTEVAGLVRSIVTVSGKVPDAFLNQIIDYLRTGPAPADRREYLTVKATELERMEKTTVRKTGS